MYNVYLVTSSGIITMPIAPEKINYKISKNNDKYNVLNIGDVIFAGEAALDQWSWESHVDFPDTTAFIEQIEKLKALKEPIRLVINRRMPDGQFIFDTNAAVLLDSCEIEDRGGEPGRIYYSIAFTEFREMKAIIL